MMILTAVISAFFAGSVCAKTPVKNSVETEQENYIPSYEKCSYENDELWVQENNYCPEGDIRCKNLLLVIVNKKTGDFNYMRGTYYKSYNFFSDNKYDYLISEDENNDNLITISKYDKNTDFKNQKIIKLHHCKK